MWILVELVYFTLNVRNLTLFRCLLPLAWFAMHGSLPTLQEMQGIWDVGAEPDQNSASADDMKAYQFKINRLVWYLDHWLPFVVGSTFWGPLVRPFHLMTDLTKIEGDVSGKEKVRVTVTSEAFALLLFANCREKWLACWKYFAANPGAKKTPKWNKDDESTHKYHNLWSNSRTGQVEGGGWSVDALEYLNDAIGMISNFRAEDKANGYAKMKFGRDLLKGVHEVNSNKRPAEPTNAEDEATAKKVKIIVLDE